MLRKYSVDEDSNPRPLATLPRWSGAPEKHPSGPDDEHACRKIIHLEGW